jgi:transposase
MNFTAIDYHKRYSFASALNEQGQRIGEARIVGNSPAGFVQFFRSLGGPSKVVVEACWNWGWLYDQLQQIEEVTEVVLAHPYKTRLIAEAQVKTDRLDARTLAQLLRADLIARAHVPSAATRQRKNVLRQRLFWVKLRTAIRNRLHTLLARQPQLRVPDRSDLFGKQGRQWLERLELPDPDGWLLRQDRELLALLDAHVREIERYTEAEIAEDANLERLRSIPGIGSVLAAVIGTEIDTIERFVRPAKFTAYAGLMPTTRASGGHCYHGPLVSGCNRWLRWALVEAAWTAVGSEAYLGAFYRHHRGRGKSATIAITIVARRLAQIVWHVLREQRDYEARNWQITSDRSEVRLAGCS